MLEALAAWELDAALDRLTGIDAHRGVETRWRIAGALVPVDRVAALELLDADAGFSRPAAVPEEIYADTLWRLGRAAEEASELAFALEVYGALGETLPGTVRGADAAYRAARLLEEEGRLAEAHRVLATAATHPDDLDRRLAESAVAYHEVIGPLIRQESP